MREGVARGLARQSSVKSDEEDQCENRMANSRRYGTARL